MRDKGCGHKPRDPGATQGCRQQKGPSLEPPQEHSPVPPDAGLHLQSLEAALLHSGALRSWAGSLSRGRGGTPVGACVQRREDEAPGCAGELAPGTPQVNGGQRGGGHHHSQRSGLGHRASKDQSNATDMVPWGRRAASERDPSTAREQPHLQQQSLWTSGSASPWECFTALQGGCLGGRQLCFHPLFQRRNGF